MKLKEAVEYLLTNPSNKITKKNWGNDEYLTIGVDGDFIRESGKEYYFNNVNGFLEDCWEVYLDLHAGDIIKIVNDDGSYGYLFLVKQMIDSDYEAYTLYNDNGCHQHTETTLYGIKSYLLKYYKIISLKNIKEYLHEK